jgi:sporulation protein YlmC with PRC-barrel domain
MDHLTHSQISCSTAAGCTVKTPRDEKVGSIEDIMIDTRTGEVSYVVLKVNEGFLNLGSKLLALPWESFQFDTSQDDVVIVKESEETLENSPGFDEDNWPTGPQHEFIQSIHTYYGQENRSLFGVSRGEYADSLEDEMVGRRTQDHQMQQHTSGDSFLEKKREDEKLTNRRGGNPIL